MNSCARGLARRRLSWCRHTRDGDGNGNVVLGWFPVVCRDIMVAERIVVDVALVPLGSFRNLGWIEAVIQLGVGSFVVGIIAEQDCEPRVKLIDTTLNTAKALDDRGVSRVAVGDKGKEVGYTRCKSRGKRGLIGVDQRRIAEMLDAIFVGRIETESKDVDIKIESFSVAVSSMATGPAAVQSGDPI